MALPIIYIVLNLIVYGNVYDILDFIYLIISSDMGLSIALLFALIAMVILAYKGVLWFFNKIRQNRGDN
jgi:hypothetical protein